MAGSTIAGIDAHVVKRHIRKVNGAEMASIATLSGRYVVRQYAHAGNIIVARCAVASDDTDMIICASAESARGMAVATILITGRTRIVRIGRHVFVD